MSYITPILYWLPVKFRIRFKILVLTFQTYYGVGPVYISELVNKYHIIISLGSNNTVLLGDPKIKGKIIWSATFFLCCTSNQLPLYIKNIFSKGD